MREPQFPPTNAPVDNSDAVVVAGIERMTADQRPHFLNLIRGLTDDDWPLVERSMVALNVEQHMPMMRAVMKMEG